MTNEWSYVALQEQANYKRRTLDEVKASKNHIIQWLLLEENKEHKEILEIGCGIGIYMGDYITMGFEDPLGIELDEVATRIAWENLLLVALGDMRDMPYDNNRFDIVTAHGSIEHIPETEVVLKEIYRVLKKDGLLLLNVPYKYSFFVLAKWIQKLFKIWRCGYEKSFGQNELINLLEDNGFKIIEIKWSEIEVGTRHPFLTKCLRFLDKIINGKHMIWIKCQKK